MIKKLFFIGLCFSFTFLATELNGQETLGEIETEEEFYDSKGKFRVDVSIFGGGGSEKFDMFETTEGDIITLSPGGGFGGRLSVGYCFSSLLNLNAEIGAQQSTLSKELENADGSFRASVEVSAQSVVLIGIGNEVVQGNDSVEVQMTVTASDYQTEIIH